MSKTEKIRQAPSRKRHLIILTAIAFFLLTVGSFILLPFFPGNHNRKQIAKIHSFPSSGHFSFAVMGDNKLGVNTFIQILNDLDNNHYIFAIDVGDFVPDGKMESYLRFCDLIENVKTPFLVALGNHEISEKGSGNYYDIFGKFYYSFDYANSLFVVLDSAHGKGLDADQMKWLEDQLTKGHQHKFVFLHVPPFDPRPGESHCMHASQNAGQFMDLMEEYRPDVVFASHIHVYFDEMKNAVNYVITGGAGCRQKGGNPEHYFHHYVKVEVTGDQVRKEVVRFN